MEKVLPPPLPPCHSRFNFLFLRASLRVSVAPWSLRLPVKDFSGAGFIRALPRSIFPAPANFALFSEPAPCILVERRHTTLTRAQPAGPSGIVLSRITLG